MREVKRSALVPYTAEQMFALVEDIERYPQFLPWVTAAQLVERTASEVVGRLEMHRAGMREIITTRNVLNPPGEITLALVAVSMVTGIVILRQHGYATLELAQKNLAKRENPLPPLLHGELAHSSISAARNRHETSAQHTHNTRRMRHQTNLCS